MSAKNKKFNSSWVKYVKYENKKFGILEYFIKVCNCKCSKICNNCNTDCKIYAVIKTCRAKNVFHCLNSSLSLKNIFVCESLNNDIFDIVRVEDINCVCFNINVEDVLYIIQAPNYIENE